MSNDTIHSEIGSLFVAAGRADGSAEQTVRNAYETLLGYDTDTMDHADERVGYWTDRLDDDLDDEAFIATFLHQAETHQGEHVGATDFASNILAVRAARDDIEPDADSLPSDEAAAAARLEDVTTASGNARSTAQALSDGQRDEVLLLEPDAPTPEWLDDDAPSNGDNGEIETLTLAEAMAATDDDELPPNYELSDGALDLGETSVSAAEDSLAAAQTVIDGSTNADSVSLDASYALRDGPDAFDGRSGEESLFADADAVVLEGEALALDSFAFDAAGSGDGSRRVEVDAFDHDLLIQLEDLTGFDRFDLGGSAAHDPDAPGFADLFLPDGAGLDVVAESQVHVVLGAGGQTFVASSESDRVVAGNDSATDQLDLSAGGSNTVAFNGDLLTETALSQQFSVDGFEPGFGGDVLDVMPVADGPGLNNTQDGEDQDLMFQIVGTGEVIGANTTIVAFQDGEAGTASDLATEFATSSSPFSASQNIGTGPIPIARNENFDGDSQLLFLVADGAGNTGVWYWDDTAGDGDVAADELGLLASLEGVADPGAMNTDNFAGLPTLLSTGTSPTEPELAGGL